MRIAFVLGAAACLSLSIPAAADEFPAGATAPKAPDVQQHVSGKVFDAKLANGASWRLQYDANGFFYINVSTGYSDSGKWKVEDGRLCHDPKKSNAGCNDVRMQDGILQLKRDSGEIIKYVPRP